MLGTILMVFAFVFAVCAALGFAVPRPPLHLGWLALAFYILAVLFGGGSFHTFVH